MLLQMLKLEEDEDPSQYQMAIVPARNNSTSSSCPLPDGWVVEEVPRNKPHGYVDRVHSVSKILAFSSAPKCDFVN